MKDDYPGESHIPARDLEEAKKKKKQKKQTLNIGLEKVC